MKRPRYVSGIRIPLPRFNIALTAISGRVDRRMFVAGSCIALLIAISLLSYLIWSGYKEAILLAETTTRNYASIIEARLDATLRRVDADLRQLARAIPVAALDRGAVPRYARALDAELDSRLVNFPEVTGMRVFDARGTLLYSSGRDSAPPATGVDRDYFRLLRDNPRSDFVISEVIVGRASNRPLVVAARALRDEHDGFRGIVYGAIDIKYFETLFQPLEIGPSGIIAIYRKDDFSRVMRYPPSDGQLNSALPLDSPTRHALAMDNRTATIEISSAADGMVRIYSYHALENYPFFVSVGVAHKDALAAWKTRSLAVGAIALLLVGLLAVLLYRLLRAESSLQERNAWFAAVFEQAAVGMALRDINPGVPRWLLVNQKLSSILGYTREELLRLDSIQLTPPEDREAVRQINVRLARGEISSDSREKRYVRKDGTVIWGRLSLSAISNADGHPTHLISVVEDISERRQNEEARAYLAAIIAGSSDAIVSRTLDRRISSWNPAAERLFGYSAEEIIGQDASLLIPPDRAEEARLSRERLTQGAPVIDLETVRVAKDGRRINVSLSQSPIHDNQGTMVGVALLFRDIAERKHAEAVRASLEMQLRESQKMEAVGTLAGGIAHDFNNIIATILGNAELAYQDMRDHPRALESLDEIRKASRRARDVVQQILSFSRRQPTERTAVALTAVVGESVRLLRASLPARITLDFEYDTALPAVLADATQIQQLVLNLVTNSMQAMQGRPGRVHLHLDAVTIDAALALAHPQLRALYERHPGRAVRLALSDDGPGMDAATMARIFEPFFTTKAVDEGSGLGLSVVHGIVRTHEGAIEVDSQPGAGATFTLYLPAAAAQVAPPVAEASAVTNRYAPHTGDGQRVLYIDDDESLVFLITRALERRGYRVSGYVSQHAALDALRADPAQFDVVVTDYNMPGMSGLDVARTVHAIRAELPLAIVSGFIDEELRAQAGGAGVRELIFKANSIEDLCDAIARLAQAAPVVTAPSRGPLP